MTPSWYACLRKICLSSLCLAVLLGLASTSNAQSLTTGPSLEPAQIEALAQQLEQASFSERENALRVLQALDHRALPKLKQLQEASTDLEASEHLDKLVRHLEQKRFEELSRLFLQAEPHPDVQDLYCWKYFSKMLGESRTSKILFLEMSSAQPRLAQLIRDVADARETNVKRNQATEDLRQHMVEQSLQLYQQRLTYGQRPEIGEIAGILVASTVMEETPIEVDEFLETCAHVVPVTEYLSRRGYKDSIRTLYNEWLPKSHLGMSYNAISIAMRMDLPNGAVIARRCLDPKFDIRQRQRAIECLARFGNESDLPVLAELLQDKSICQEYPDRVAEAFGNIEESLENPPGVQPASARPVIYRVRICDMSLAAILLLYDEELEDVFPKFRSSVMPRSSFSLYETAVATDEESLKERDQHLEAYRARVLESSAGEPSNVPDVTDV